MHQNHQRRLWGPQIHYQCQTVCQVCGGPQRPGGSNWHWGGNESWVRLKQYFNVLRVSLKVTCWQLSHSMSYPFSPFSVDRNKYQIHIPLPPKIDPTVTMMQVPIHAIRTTVSTDLTIFNHVKIHFWQMTTLCSCRLRRSQTWPTVMSVVVRSRSRSWGK